MEAHGKTLKATAPGMLPLALITLLLLSGITSCAVKKRTVRDISVAVKDTVYVERSVQTNKYSRDTLIIERVVTEYYPDTAGNWVASRRSVTTGRDVAVATSTETETEATVSTASADMQGQYAETVEQQKFSRWRWFLAGAATILVLLAAACIAKRVYFHRIV